MSVILQSNGQPFQNRPRTPKRNLPTLKTRKYEAAESSRLFADWGNQPQPIDLEIRRALQSLRHRSRDLAQNNPYMKRFKSLVKKHTVGPNGFKYEACAVSRTGNKDIRANDALEKSWKKFAGYGVADVTGTRSLRDFFSSFIDGVVGDGEAIIRLIRNWNENEFGLGLQLLDPELLDIEHTTQLQNGNWIIMGVEFNSFRRPIAYHMLEHSPSLSFQGYQATNRVRIPANEILHRFLPDWVFQSRGVPLAAAAMIKMQNADGYEDAELVASRTGASKMGFFTRNAEGEGFTGEGSDEDDCTIMDAEPGTFEQLPNGVGFQAWDPTHPTTAFADFMKVILRAISTGLDVNYNTLAGDYENINLSSIRQATLEDRETWMMLQNWMIGSTVDIIHDAWLEMSLLRGAIRTDNGSALPPEKIDKFRAREFTGRRWEWVMLKEEGELNRLKFEMRQQAPSDMIRAQGADPEITFQKIADDVAKLKELGIPINLERGMRTVEEAEAAASAGDSSD